MVRISRAVCLRDGIEALLPTNPLHMRWLVWVCAAFTTTLAAKILVWPLIRDQVTAPAWLQDWADDVRYSWMVCRASGGDPVRDHLPTHDARDKRAHDQKSCSEEPRCRADVVTSAV